MKKIALFLVLFLGGCAVLNLDRPFYHRSEVETPDDNGGDTTPDPTPEVETPDDNGGDTTPDPTPSEALVSLIGGETLVIAEHKDVVYKIATMKFNSNATTVSVYSDYNLSFDRTSSYNYTDGGEDYATYEGTDKNLGAVRIELKNIEQGKYYPTGDAIVYTNGEVYMDGIF